MLVRYKWSKARPSSYTSMVFLVTFTKASPIPIQNNMHSWWIEIKEIPKYKIYDNNGDLSKTTSWYHSNNTKRNPWVMLCSHCPFNNSSGFHTLPSTLQLCYKHLGILPRVTKSQKVHISSHDEFQKLHNVNFAWHRSSGFLRERVEKQEFPLSPVTFFKNNQKRFPCKLRAIYHTKWGAGMKLGFSYRDTLWTFLLWKKQILLTSEFHWLAMMQMKTIIILNIYLFFRQLIQMPLSIISTVFLNKG